MVYKMCEFMHNCGNMYGMRKDVFRNLCKANIFKIIKKLLGLLNEVPSTYIFKLLSANPTK